MSNFLEDCKEIKRQVQYWGVMQQKKRQSLEARMRDLRIMSSLRKPDRLELSQLVSGMRTGAHTYRDKHGLSVGASMVQMSLSPKGRAVHEHGHESERGTTRSWGYAGRFPAMDPAPTHTADHTNGVTNGVTGTNYPGMSGRGAGVGGPGGVGGGGVAEFAPLVRRQRCTTQRLQEKNAAQTHMPVSRGGFGAHKPVGPQCKFLPIMLGSLRGADSSSSES